MIVLYKRIKQLRETLGFSQEKLANLVGYTSKTSIAKIESGKVDIPQSKIELFAKALQTTPAYLMGWEEEQKVPILTKKDERDVAKDVERIMGNLEDGGDLMFDGVPMSEEAKAAMAAAMRIGLEEAKRRNKATYTPKRYRKG